jgi:restriction system protein
MAIPDFQSIMLPLVRLCGDGQEHTTGDAVESLAIEFSLSEDDRKALLSSGVQGVFANRVSWAKTHLKMAGLLENPRRGVVKITPRGLEVLRKKPSAINLKFLRQFPEYVQFASIRRTKAEFPDEPESNPVGTPEEALESAYTKIRDDLAADILQRLKTSLSAWSWRLSSRWGMAAAGRTLGKPLARAATAE